MRQSPPECSYLHQGRLPSAIRTVQLLDGLASFLRFAFRAVFIAMLVIGVVG